MPSGRPPVPAIDRFITKFEVDPVSGCHIWNAATYSDRGYHLSGQFYDGQRNVRAHRFAYEYQFGPIPEGMMLYSNCDTTLCVLPAHYELGPPNRRCAEAERCPQGHRYAGSNLVINSANGGRQCRTCLAEQSRRSEARPAPYRLRQTGNYRADIDIGAVVIAYALGESVRKIAADMGTNKTTIRRRLRAVGAPVRVAG